MASDDGDGRRGADPFLIPGTRTLKNKLNLGDPNNLEVIERLFSRRAQRQRIPDLPISAAGFQEIHKHLFGQIYSWAGQVRTAGTLAKGDATFLPGRFVAGALVMQFQQIGAENNLMGLSAERFAERAAFHICEINHIHPFREGNGRTMRFFLRELAHQAGHNLDITRIEGTAWMYASRQGAVQNFGPMTIVLRRAIIDPRQSAGLPAAADRPSHDLAELKADVIGILPTAREQAADRLYACMTALKGDPKNPHLSEAVTKAETVLDWLHSDRGPLHQLAVLREAGVNRLAVRTGNNQGALHRVMAIGRAAHGALEKLGRQELARARQAALDVENEA